MDSIVEVALPSEDLRLYFTEVTDCNQETELEDEEHTLLDEAEQATDFLQKAGLSDLSKIYHQGKEITDAIVNDSIRQRHLTEKQAHTVRSRIRTLNKTLRNRQPRRKQRQDVRDVAWNTETSSTGSRSRSATPDSLDSIGALNEELTSDEDQSLSLPHFSVDGGNVMPKGKLKLTSSEPLQTKVFQRPDRGNVARLDSDKVVLKGYHALNEFTHTITPQRDRSGSDPTTEVHLKLLQNDSEGYLSSSPNFIVSHSPTNVSSDPVELSFEGLIRRQEDTYVQTLNCEDIVCIDDITDCEYQYLKPLLWVEVTAIFDQHKIFVLKRKANNKRKRGNVFNVNLSTLVMRDLPTPLDNSMVPQVYQSIISHLTVRGIREDGVMRVAGQKQKLDMLCKEIEEKFYNNRQFVERLLSETNVHDLTGVLKKLLRELPDPIFTMELFDMFYKSSMIPELEDKVRAFNLLVLLLPIEHRNTFRLLLQFFLNVIAHEQYNRMSLHNVAMIIAPSFFPPRLVAPGSFRTPADTSISREQLTKQIKNAAICCSIMELLLRTGENLWMIPKELVVQAQEAQKRVQDRRQLGAHMEKKVNAGKKKLHRSRTQYEPGSMLSPKITRDFIM